MARSFWIFRLKSKAKIDPCELFDKLRESKPYTGIDYAKVYKLVQQIKEGSGESNEIHDFDEGFNEPVRVVDALGEHLCTITFTRASLALRLTRGAQWPTPRFKSIIIQLWALEYDNDFYIIVSTGDDKLVENVILKYLEKIGISADKLEKIALPREFIEYVNQHPGNPPILDKYNIENIGLYGREGEDWVKAAYGSSERKEIPRIIKPKESMRLMVPVPYKKSQNKRKEGPGYIKAWFYYTGKITLSSRGDINLQKYEIENLLYATLLLLNIIRKWETTIKGQQEN